MPGESVTLEQIVDDLLKNSQSQMSAAEKTAVLYMMALACGMPPKPEFEIAIIQALAAERPEI